MSRRAMWRFLECFQEAMSVGLVFLLVIGIAANNELAVAWSFAGLLASVTGAVIARRERQTYS